MLQYTCVHISLQDIKKFMNETFKYTGSGKTYVDQPPCIEGCVNTSIQDTYNISNKTPPVDYANMLLTTTKIIKGKNICQAQWENIKASLEGSVPDGVFKGYP